MKHVSVDLTDMLLSLAIHRDKTWKPEDFALHEEVVLDTNLLGPLAAEVVSISERYVDVKVKGRP